MNHQDIRWARRFDNFKKALLNLRKAVELARERELSKLEKQGLIQAFEISYELIWNTLKDFYQLQGETEIQGSRDAFRIAFNRGLIEDGDLFMKIIKSRQLTSHSYNEEIADMIFHDVVNEYLDAFQQVENRLEKEKNKFL